MMHLRMRALPASILSILAAALLASCGGSAATDDAADTDMEAEAKYAIGTVTLDGGQPLSGDIRDISIAIEGVSEAGERISYTPIVKNGQYRQKLVPGQYRFSWSTITLRFNGKDFRLPLVPVGNNATKNQDAADGIVQHFVWKPTGFTTATAAEADPNNHTHWYGMSMGMRFATYREDLKDGAVAPPEGTKLTFTAKPLSKAIDGRELQPVVFQRDWRATSVTKNDDLNDLPPADWEITGFATFPDGTKKTIVFQGKGNYPNFVVTGQAPLDQDGILSGYWKQLFSWGLQ